MFSTVRRCESEVVLVSFALHIAFASAARASDEVGVVAGYRPPAARFQVARADSESIPVRIGTLVRVGDQLTLPAGASVIVQLHDGLRHEFAGPGSFEIPDAPPLGKVLAIFRSISKVFDDEYRMAGTAASRSGDSCRVSDRSAQPIQVPILAGSSAIVAGQRDLPLAWLGGCTPFTVSLHNADGSIVSMESVRGRQTRLDDLPLVVGHYSVVIADATGLQFRGSIEAVSSAPELPRDIAHDQSPLGVIAGALWLAAQENGRWRFDSFERLRPLIRAGDALAGAIGDGLLWSRYEP